jgi:hypothetical protein
MENASLSHPSRYTTMHSVRIVDNQHCLVFAVCCCAGQSDSFVYTVTDCNNNSASAAVTLVFAAPPTARDDAYDFAGGQIVKLAAAGVLANDVNAASCQLTSALAATLVSKPANGALVLDRDGAFVYTPTNGAASKLWLELQHG